MIVETTICRLRRILAVSPASWVVLAMALSATLLIQTAQGAEGLPDQIQLNGHSIQLNGSGTRKKAFISLYDAGLYLGQSSQDAEAIVHGDAPMAIRLVILSGFISAKKMISAMTEGFEKSTGGDTHSIAAEIELFSTGFSEEIAKQDTFDLLYQPDVGVEVVKNGESKVTVAGLEFKQAMFGIWLSENPVQKSLKKGLLGL